MSTNSKNIIDVAVIGGGIGGLVAAVALNRVGIEAHCYEQAPVFGEAGGHLTIDTAVLDVLKQWQLDEPFMEMCVPLNGIEVRSMSTNDVITHYPIPDLASMGVDDPNRLGTRDIYAFLRADYVNKLAELMPSGRMHTEHSLATLEDGNDCATATFTNGISVTARIIIGADGVRSLARKMLDDIPAVPAGITICRSIIPASLLPVEEANDRLRFWDGWNLADGDEAINVLVGPVRGGSEGAIDVLLHGGDQLAGVNLQNVPVKNLLSRLPADIFPEVYNMVKGVTEPYVAHPLYDRPTADVWAGKSFVLLGDSAHSTRPTMGQGACQAIHDAGALVKAFAEFGLSNKALKSYESVRAPYVKSVIEVAKKTKMDPKAWKNYSEKEKAAS